MNPRLRQLVGRVVRATFPRVAYPVLRGPLKGARFVLGSLSGRGCGSSVYFNLVEQEQTIVVQNMVTMGETFFDIGANVGYYSILASRLVGPNGTVIAIEPSVRNVAYLYRHKQLNRAKNMMIVFAACSDRTGLASFVQGSSFAEGHLQPDRNIRRTPTGGYSVVPTVSVDDLVARLGSEPDTIKIDIEGAELSVLHGAEGTLKKTGPRVFLSVHSAALRTDCLEYLHAIGYRSRGLDGNESEASQYLLTRETNGGHVRSS